MKTLEVFLKDISHEDMVQVMKDYDILAEFGAIGDCRLRALAEEYRVINEFTSPIQTMVDIHGVVTRSFAKKYLQLNGITND